MGYVGQTVQELVDTRQRLQEKPRKRWFKTLKENRKKVSVRLEDALDKNAWR